MLLQQILDAPAAVPLTVTPSKAKLPLFSITLSTNATNSPVFSSDESIIVKSALFWILLVVSILCPCKSIVIVLFPYIIDYSSILASFNT